MSNNKLFLIRELATRGHIASRYTELDVINCNPLTGSKGHSDPGAFSVLFRGRDTTSGSLVAIKFFDPDVDVLRNTYRLDLFQRESGILEHVENKKRCLQLIEPIQSLDLHIPGLAGTVTLRCYYFVTEWLPDDVETYFLQQDATEALAKLDLFRDVVLSVASLHGERIYHRDLKPDNLRLADRNPKECVVTIDYGTAVRHSDPSLGTPGNYRDAVGMLLISPIEARCGFSGDRALNPYTDIFSLGCMLHDLFVPEPFYPRMVADTGFKHCFAACHLHMAAVFATRPRLEDARYEWRKTIRRFKQQVNMPTLKAPSTTVPLAAVGILDDLLARLVPVDCFERVTDFKWIVRRIDSARRAITNDMDDRRRRLLRAKWRQMRQEKRERKLIELS